MRNCLLGWGVFGVLLLGCSGTNVVAGTEKTKAQQLADAVPAWCQTICQRIGACPQSQDCACSGDACDCSQVSAKCPSECQQAMARWTNGSGVCADAGQRFKDCLDATSCNDLQNSSTCRPTEADQTACPDPNGSDDPPDSTGLSSDPSAASGGTSGSSSGSAGSAGAPVTCQGSYAGGTAGSAATSDTVLCEGGTEECSDGHSYSWICAVDSQNQHACSCLVDGTATGGFTPPSDCPQPADVNAGCHWNLVQ